MTSEPLSIKDIIVDGLQDRLKDPMIGAFCASFLIVNWDMIVVLLNYKEAFHENIYFIKSSFYPFVLASKQFLLNESLIHWINRVSRPWHLLRLLMPIITTYIWLFHWPVWSRDWFKKVNQSRQDRVDIIDEIKEKSLVEREKMIGIREENLSLKEKIKNHEEEIAKFEILLQEKDKVINGQNYDLQGLEQLKGSLSKKLNIKEALEKIKKSAYNFLRDADIQKILELNDYNARSYSPNGLNISISRKSELENFISIAKANNISINYHYSGGSYVIDQITWS